MRDAVAGGRKPPATYDEPADGWQGQHFAARYCTGFNISMNITLMENRYNFVVKE